MDPQSLLLSTKQPYHDVEMSFNPFPHNKILDFPKFIAFAGNEID